MIQQKQQTAQPNIIVASASPSHISLEQCNKAVSSQFQIRQQIATLLNQQYLTTQFTACSHHSFKNMVNICESALRAKIYPVLYGLNSIDIRKYGIHVNYCEHQPFAKQQIELLQQLCQICQKVINQPGYQPIQVVNQYVKQGRVNTLNVQGIYRRFQLNFKYLNIKEAIVFTALSQCNVWYTIVKNRRKSKKQFDLDPLINFFEQLVQRLKLQNPYHIDILPKKQVKSINKKQNQQKSTNPLFEAVYNGDHELVKQMLQKGAKIQLPSFLNNRMKTQVKCAHQACLHGDLKMCKILNSFGVNWESQDSQKMTPIFYAIQSANMPTIKYLVQQIKVNIEKQETQSRTPFYWACAQGDISIIDYFYKAGCNINQKSELGRTALSKSCYLGRRDIVEYLLQRKEIDMYSQCKKGRTALHNAVFGPKGGRQGHKFGTNQKDSPECAQILLEKGINVDILDFEDCTSLHVAMSSDAIDSIRLLVAYGASLTLKNNYGQTPLMTGAKFGHVQSCKFLYQQCNADIMCIDIFNKNLLLLTAKFQQNSQIQGTINPGFIYFLQPFIKQCLVQNKVQQLYRTFHEIAASQFAQKMVVQMTLLWQGFKKYGVTGLEISIGEIQKILQVSMKCSSRLASKDIQDRQRDQCLNYVQFSKQVLTNITLSKEKLQQIHEWLIKCNQPKILQFVHQNELLCLQKLQLPPKYLFSIFENDELALKQKVVSFCILVINFDWVSYRTQQNSNLLHLLVRKQRSGCIVQLFKALSGKIPLKILANKYINKLGRQECQKVLQTMLWEKDESGLDAYQLSLVLKNKSVAKLIQQKLKQQNLQFSSVLDVKEYGPILQTDPKQLEIFNNFQHQKQQKLAQFQAKVSSMSAQQISKWWGFRQQIKAELEILKQQNQHHQAHQQFWKQIQNRPLHFITRLQDLPILSINLPLSPVIGIDIQYFTYQSTTMISLFQISSLTDDYIIDCLNVDLAQIKKYIMPLLYNQNMLKIMHGADNDLILTKSMFNLSVVNFVDSSRLDVQLRENKYDLRGLATLAKDYMGVSMSKQYQVSQWRIRPIPKAMLQYAKKDSLILPYLLVQMLNKIKDDPQRIRHLILAGCKQVRRNKKVSQPLIKGIRAL